jgi:hypothetical protein
MNLAAMITADPQTVYFSRYLRFTTLGIKECGSILKYYGGVAGSYVGGHTKSVVFPYSWWRFLLRKREKMMSKIRLSATRALKSAPDWVNPNPRLQTLNKGVWVRIALCDSLSRSGG